MEDMEFKYVVDQFADIQVLRYQVPGFEALSLRQKQLLYHLSEAALMGRDILYDQNGRYNLVIRQTLEAIFRNYAGDRTTDDYRAFETYLKRVWFANGIHHHYAEDKFAPGFSEAFFEREVRALPACHLPLQEGESVDDLLAKLKPVIFDPDEEWIVDPEEFASKGRNTPFAGRTLRGKVKYTIVGGQIVYADEKGR